MSARTLGLVCSLLILVWADWLPAQTLQGAINLACASNGVVTMSATYPTITSTVNVSCPSGTNTTRLQLNGAPTTLNCNTGGTPCLTIGSSSYTGWRPQITVRDVQLVGSSTALSEGIQVQESAAQAMLDNIRIDYFDTGMHFVASSAALLFGTYVSNAIIGYGYTNATASLGTVNNAVHFDGPGGNINFVNFVLSAQVHLILADGDYGSGSGATFTNGAFNTTYTPGAAAVLIDGTGASTFELMLSNIQDWETQCPYLDIGHNARVVIDGIGFMGNASNPGGYTGIRMLPGDVSYLRISNALLVPCAGVPASVNVASASTFLTITGSDLAQVNFTAPGQASLVGNRCSGITGTAPNLVNVRASANVGSCPDR